MPAKKPKRRSAVSPSERALKYLSEGRTQDALAWADEAYQSNDQNDLLAASRIYKSAGKLEKLLAIYRRLHTLAPEARPWKIAIACALSQQAKEAELTQHLKEAGVEPLEATELMLIAAAAADTSHFSLATKFYRQATDAAVEAGEDELYAAAVIPLAAMMSQTGERDQAKRLLTSFLESEIKDNQLAAQGWFNLGVIAEPDNQDLAVKAFRRSLVLAPEYELPIPNLAILLTRLGQLEETIEFLKPVVERKIDLPRSAILLASANRLNGNPDAAIAILENIVDNESDSNHTELAWEMLTRIQVEQGSTAKAIDRCKAWLKKDPASSIATHMLAAIQGENVPERASAKYVANTFDSFADSFDAVLTNLEYRAPQLVGHLAGQTLGQPKADKRILDAGCGTGLAGPFLRPFAKDLIGVDLSQGMLERARLRGCYDELRVADLLDFMRDETNQRQFDVIAAADTFNYFGDLSELIPTCFSALRDDGWLIFTLELGETYGDTYHLEAHGRYTHPPSYLMEQLGQCGIEGGEMHRVVLRKENGVDVVGLLVAAQKP